MLKFNMLISSLVLFFGHFSLVLNFLQFYFYVPLHLLSIISHLFLVCTIVLFSKTCNMKYYVL